MSTCKTFCLEPECKGNVEYYVFHCPYHGFCKLHFLQSQRYKRIYSCNTCFSQVESCEYLGIPNISQVPNKKRARFPTVVIKTEETFGENFKKRKERINSLIDLLKAKQSEDIEAYETQKDLEIKENLLQLNEADKITTNTDIILKDSENEENKTDTYSQVSFENKSQALEFLQNDLKRKTSPETLPSKPHKPEIGKQNIKISKSTSPKILQKTHTSKNPTVISPQPSTQKKELKKTLTIKKDFEQPNKIVRKNTFNQIKNEISSGKKIKHIEDEDKSLVAKKSLKDLLLKRISDLENNLESDNKEIKTKKLKEKDLIKAENYRNWQEEKILMQNQIDKLHQILKNTIPKDSIKEYHAEKQELVKTIQEMDLLLQERKNEEEEKSGKYKKLVEFNSKLVRENNELKKQIEILLSYNKEKPILA